ncbi:MAG: hypothetical protein LBK82_07025 [Planctomycetaceae bacterium]|nr:hypothetical protein [Planctomycetaceae bacterium]
MLPFQGDVLLNLTRRVAAGWLVLPLKGRRKTCYPTEHQNSNVNVCFADFFNYGAEQPLINNPLASPALHYQLSTLHFFFHAASRCLTGRAVAVGNRCLAGLTSK